MASAQGRLIPGPLPAGLFLDLLYQNVMEGFFSDPAYGGNRNKASWKMIGYSGATGNFVDLIETTYNKPYTEEPQKHRRLKLIVNRRSVPDGDEAEIRRRGHCWFRLDRRGAGQELTKAGLNVVAIERGGMRDTTPEFSAPMIHDELRFAIRHDLMQDASRETLTFRNNVDQTALPIRRWGSFLPGNGVGGAGVHWNGQHYRFAPSEFRIRSHYQGEIRQEVHSRRNDDSGLARHLRRT